MKFQPQAGGGLLGSERLCDVFVRICTELGDTLAAANTHSGLEFGSDLGVSLAGADGAFAVLFLIGGNLRDVDFWVFVELFFALRCAEGKALLVFDRHAGAFARDGAVFGHFSPGEAEDGQQGDQGGDDGEKGFHDRNW